MRRVKSAFALLDIAAVDGVRRPAWTWSRVVLVKALIIVDALGVIGARRDP